MIKKKFYIVGLLFAMLCCVKGQAQDISARIAGMESNKEYMQLLRSEAQVRQQTDSVMMVIRGVRNQMKQQAEERDSLSQERNDSMMLVLSDSEGLINALRAQKVKLMDQINAMEQDFVLASVENIGSAGSAQGSNSLYNNAYFAKSIAPEDYKLLLEMHASEKATFDYVRNYVTNYSKIKALTDKYILAQTEAESEALYAEMSGIMAENIVLERQIAKVWSDIYDHKCYVYSYFLEKENRMDLLNITDNMMQEARQQKLNTIDECVSEYVADYCLQKPVVLNYEIYVAKMLNLTPAIDSLSRAARNVRSLDYKMPVLEVERRSFVNYEPIEFHNRSPYNSSNPIPECVNYEYGTIYRILLGTFKYNQQPSIFRGAAPLYVQTEEDGRFSYYAGGLRTRGEAESAVEVMKKKGFRNPQIVEWCDGEKTNLSAEGVVRASYRIAISGGGLDDMVREVITTMAEGCQLSKLAEDKFMVSSFESRAVAERVAEAIEKCDDSLTVEVQEIKSESESEE